MRQKVLTFILAALATWALAAQESFQAGPFLQVQGGVAYDRGEGSFLQSFSPAAQVAVGYRFTPVVGLRLGVSGYQAKNYTEAGGDPYHFRFVQPSLDLQVDLASLFGGWKADRMLAPYAFVGGGAAYGFDNDEAVAAARAYRGVFANLWEKDSWHYAGRAGVGAGIRLGKCVDLNLEVGGNMLDDRFNSKKGQGSFNPDWHVSALAGLTFHLGRKAAKAAAAAVPAVVYVPKEVTTPKPEPAVEPKPEPVVEPKPEILTQTEKVDPPVEERLIFEGPVPVVMDTPEPLSVDAFFLIDSAVIRNSEEPALLRLVAYLKEHPEASVLLSGYADKETGTPPYNLRLSERRVQSVKTFLTARGIDASRIETAAKGDTVQPYKGVKNRVVIGEAAVR